ncbi:MAG: LiaI-LiaF-like domain-containing protein [Candidatus Eiseniibacteriota bacterium]
MADGRPKISVQLIFGLAVATLGVLFTLDNLDMIQSGRILRWWPVVLVLVGLTRLWGSGPRSQSVAGVLITAAGLVLLLGSLDLIHFGIWDLWPLVMVFAGAFLVWRVTQRAKGGGQPVDPDDYANAFVMMGAVVRKMSSSQFRGGEATAFMGGVELDLRNAHPASSPVVMDVLAWWGGIELWVPPDWKVTSEVLPIMAGYEDKTKPQADAKTHLILRGLVVMGGIEVGN